MSTDFSLWSMPSSGNSYKVRLLLAHLGITYTHHDAEMGTGVTQSTAFRALKPDGKVPLVNFADGRLLRESNAICVYFGLGTDWLPDDRFAHASVMQWLFFEQYSHEPAIAVRAGILAYEERAHLRTPEILDPLLEKGHAALATMERQLTQTPFLIGDTPTLADLCLYAYTHSAGAKGGFEMQRFEAVNAWLDRVSALPGHVPLEWLPG
ncbi:MAG: glutathione S-transferase family protein [Pseudomonadota bacterium]